MCGIAGVISWDEKYRVTRDTLQRMSARLAHRGPDGEGFYLNHEQEITPDRPQCGFAFRRLAILDPDPRAMQPFTIGDKTIVFNGEIYNFRELRDELKGLRPDYAWRTTGDTEVLLLAYDVWGEKCLDRLNGMFAFAVWDECSKELFLARDRMGQKPLYVAFLDRAGGSPGVFDYHVDPGLPAAVAFASELGAMRALGWVNRSLDADQLALYLSVGYTDAGTIHQGVRQLKPGCWLKVTARGCPQGRYFCAEGTERNRDGHAAETTRALVKRAVERQLVSDVPLGCFLSGGVDSSVIAAAMRGAEQETRTFTVGYDDDRYDESGFARAVAQHLGTKHHEFRVRPDAAADLPKLAGVFGEPFADSSALPTHYLSRETRGHVKVALSGDGGDELFGGYDRYRALAAGEKLLRLPRSLHRVVGAALWQKIPGSHPKSLPARFKRFASSAHLPANERYASYMRLFSPFQIGQLLRPDLRDPRLGPDTLADQFELALCTGQGMTPRDPVQAALALDRMTYLPGDLLTKVDRASMLHGLEVRSPFMDHELVQFAAGLTTDQLLKGGPKRMLREAFKDDLPAWVFKRKKMGFAVPIGEWFRGELRAMLRDHLFAADSFARQHFDMKVVERLVEEHEKQTVDHSQRLYALLMLELWWRTSR